jgi:GTP-binding protein
MRAKESIKRADVAILLLDAADGMTKDDVDILRFIGDSGKACLVLVNKWDLAEKVGGVDMEDYEKHLVYAFSHLSKFPISFVSSKTGKNVLTSLSMTKVLDSNLDLKISTSFLNRIFEKKNPSAVPVPRSKKRPNFLYMVQSSSRPVEFKYFVNDPASVLPAHLSFIENNLRENLPLKGIPVKIFVRRSRKAKK